MKAVAHRMGVFLPFPVLPGLAWLFPLCWAVFHLHASGQATDNRLEEFIRHADTTYWLGQAERGDMRLFQRGILTLDEASEILPNLPEESQIRARSRIDSLRQDLEEQMDMAHDTLWGVFPLLRFSIFQAENWEWFDDPKIMATTRAAIGLRSTLVENWRNLPQMDVVYASTEMEGGQRNRTQALENEAAYLLNENPKFFNHNAMEIASALSPGEAARFYKDGVSLEMGDKLCDAFGIQRFVDFRVDEVDRFDSDYFFLAKAGMFEEGKGIGAERSFVFGFTRDATGKVWWIAVPFVLAFLGAIFLPSKLCKDDPLGRWHPPVAFFVGVAVVLVGMASISKLLPGAEMIVKYSFWYLLLAGFLLLASPLLAGIIVTKKLAGTQSFSGDEWLAALLPYSFGSVGFCAYPAFTYLPTMEAIAVWSGILLVPFTSGLSLAIGLSNGGGPESTKFLKFSYLSVACVFGATLYIIPRDDLDSLGTLALATPICWALARILKPSQGQAGGGVMAIILATLGGAFYQTGSHALAIAMAAPCLLAIPPGLRCLGSNSGKSLQAQPQSASGSIKSKPIRDGDCLSDRLRAAHEGTAPFTTCDGFPEAVEFLRKTADEKCLRFLRIRGVGGSGKSRVARELVRDCFKGNCILLEAECDVSQGQAVPYSSLAHILGQTGNLVDSGGNGHGGLIFDELCGILENIVPMGGLIKGALVSDKGQVVPIPGEIANSLVQKFAGWTDKEGCAVVLLVENAEKIDPASKEVIEALLEQIVKVGVKFPLAVIECGRESKIKFKGPTLSHTMEPKFGISRFLVRTMGLDRLLAEEADSSAGHPLRPIEMIYWVEKARREGFLKESPAPFVRAQPSGIPFPRPPEEVFNSIGELVGKLSAGSQTTLEHAACIGLEFDISDLATTRGLPTHEILGHLSEAEDERLVMDVPGRDGIYKFNSPITLEALQERLGYNGNNGLRQRALETHKLLADLYSKNLDNQLFLATKHACLGGEKYAERAALLCCKSAAESFRLNAFKDAAEYAEKALELTKYRVNAQGELRLDAYLIWFASQEATRIEESVVDRALQVWEEVQEFGVSLPGKYVNLLAKLGVILGKRDRFEEAWQIVAEAEGVVVEAPLPRLRLAHARAFLHRISNQYEEAVGLLDQAISRFGDISETDLTHKQCLAEALNTRGDTKTHLDDPNSKASGIGDIRASLAIKRETGDKLGQAMSQGAIGRHYLFSPDEGYFHQHCQEAIDAFREDFRLSEEIGDFTGQIKMPCFIGQCYRRFGQLEDAADWFRKAVSQARNHGSILDLAFALSGLAQTHHKIGNFEHRDQHGHELADICQDLSDQQKTELKDEISWVKELDGVEWATRILSLANESGLN